MHSYNHPETGVTIHYNGDYSGNAVVSIELGDGMKRMPELGDGRLLLYVPAAALAGFSRESTIKLAIQALEDL